jgi:hypothetical protein
MSLRLVRCPFCGKRFNIAGIAEGSRLRCGGCTAVLSVPREGARPRAPFRLTLSTSLQILGGVAAGLLAAMALFVLLRPSKILTSPPSAPTTAQVPKPPPPVIDSPVAEVPRDSIIPDPYARARQELQNEFPGRLMFMNGPKPYLIALELSDRMHATSLFEDYGRRLETLYTSFRREFADELRLPPVEPVLPVIIFSSRESFEQYFEGKEKRRIAPSIKGVFEYEKRRIVIYHDPSVPFEVLYHEGAHQLVNYYTTLRETAARPAPRYYWFQEGLGTYFEGLRGMGPEIKIDPGVNHGRLPTLKQTLVQNGRKDFIPLAVLVGMTVDEFWQWFEKGQATDPDETTRKAQLYYAESWAFVHFLRQSGGNAQRLLNEYFLRELSARGGKQVFEDLLRDHLSMELSQLEEKFVDYILGLRPWLDRK